MSMSETFRKKLQEERKNCKVNSLTLSKSKYKTLIDKVRLLKSKMRKEGNDYRFLKRYNTIEVNGIEKLISPLVGSGEIRYFVHDEELYDILHNAHISTNHGGRDRMKNNLKTKYTNITYKDIMLYLTLCEQCSEKQKNPKKINTTKSIPLRKSPTKSQIELIDYRSRSDGDYNFVLVYHDDSTKFVILRALKTNTIEEISENVVDIFAIFGAPSIIQSNNSKQIVEEVRNQLKNVWNDFKITYGSVRKGETVFRDIEKTLSVWLEKSATKNWSKELKYIQLLKNNSVDLDTKRTPFEALFGCEQRKGLSSLNLPPEMVENVESEEDLEKILAELQSRENTNCRKSVDDDEEQFENPEKEMEDCFITYVDKSSLEIKKRTEKKFDSFLRKPKRMKI